MFGLVVRKLLGCTRRTPPRRGVAARAASPGRATDPGPAAARLAAGGPTPPRAATPTRCAGSAPPPRTAAAAAAPACSSGSAPAAAAGSWSRWRSGCGTSPSPTGTRPAPARPPEAPVQQQVAGPHARLGRLPQQVADDVAQGLALADVGQGHGKALALADDVGGGVGVEVAGATLGRAAVDLVGVVPGAAVVGDQVQVDGEGPPAAAQGVRQVALQGAVEAALQLVDLGEGGQEGVVGGLVAGGVEQGLAGGPQRGNAG